MNEFLEILGLEPNRSYTPEEIKKAWKKKAAEHHPDRGGSQEEFIKAGHAYKMLTDPSYARKAQTGGTGKPDLDIRMQVPVDFEAAFFGRDISICFNRVEIGEDLKPVVKEEQETLYVHFKLPEGCLDGHDFFQKGYGLKFKDVFGDLIIKVTPVPHPVFRHSGADIHTQLSVPLNTMLKGGSMEVQTMYGLKTLKIPPGTGPGSRLTIPNCGVRKLGSHVVTITPIFPKKNDLKGKEWEGLGINWEEEETEKEDEFEILFEQMSVNPEEMRRIINEQMSRKRRR